jgi:hypothetical protein
MVFVIAITDDAAASSPPPFLALDSFFTLLSSLLLCTLIQSFFCSLCKASDLLYVVPTYKKYYCLMKIGDDDPCCWHEIPHL